LSQWWWWRRQYCCSVCWRCELLVRCKLITFIWEKYAVSMFRAKVHWRWRQRVSLKHFYLPTSSHGIKCHKENYHSVHLNPTLTLKLYFRKIHFNSFFLTKPGSVKRPVLLKSSNQNLVCICLSTLAY
jgi:hypothetical protein